MMRTTIGILAGHRAALHDTMKISGILLTMIMMISKMMRMVRRKVRAAGQVARDLCRIGNNSVKYQEEGVGPQAPAEVAMKMMRMMMIMTVELEEVVIGSVKYQAGKTGVQETHVARMIMMMTGFREEEGHVRKIAVEVARMMTMIHVEDAAGAALQEWILKSSVK